MGVADFNHYPIARHDPPWASLETDHVCRQAPFLAANGPPTHALLSPNVARNNFPQRHIENSLTPPDQPKEGSRFDLLITLGILVANAEVSDRPLCPHTFRCELICPGKKQCHRKPQQQEESQ